MLSEILSIITTALVGYLVWYLQKQYSVKSATAKSMKLLLRRELKQLHSEYMKKGNISSEEYTEYEELYNTYHELGGNGTGTKWFKEIESLSLKEGDD